MSNELRNQIAIFTNEKDDIKIEARVENDTLWFSLQQLAELFGRDKSVISRHLKKIFTESELEEITTIAKYATAQKERNKIVTRHINNIFKEKELEESVCANFAYTDSEQQTLIKREDILENKNEVTGSQ